MFVIREVPEEHVTETTRCCSCFVYLDVEGMVMALQQRIQQFSALTVAVVTIRHHYSVKVKVVNHNQEDHQNYQRHIGGSTK